MKVKQAGCYLPGDCSTILSSLSLSVLAMLILAACASSPKLSLRPDWIDSPPAEGRTAVGAASYEVFGEANAREKALMKALTALALQKGGTVDLESSIERRQVLTTGNSGESFRDHASIRTRAIVRGKEVPINAKIKAFWKDRRGRRIWVLVVEE